MSTLDDTPTEELLDGRYRLGECVGRGGAAMVYRAEDVKLERTVAVKIMLAGTDGPDAGARTRREVAALAAIDHACLVTLLDAKIVPGGPEYLVMEFVDGRSLRERLDEGPLTGSEVVDLASDLAEALRAVHGAGVVHRDIKPSNVLLAQTGIAARPVRAKLADFGIAQLLDNTRLTSPGMVLGTPAYVAPEQARGAAPAPTADIFALGVVLIEALTGRRPYADMTPAEAVAARQAVPPPVPERLDAGWAQLLRRMTDLAPPARPTAAEVATIVQRLGPPWPVAGDDQATPGASAPASTRALSAPADASGDRAPRKRGAPRVAELGACALAALLAVAAVWAAGIARPLEPVSGAPAVVEISTPATPGRPGGGSGPTAEDAGAAREDAVTSAAQPEPEPDDGRRGSGVGPQEADPASQRAEQAWHRAENAQQTGAQQRAKNASDQGRSSSQNGRSQ
ncbi:protein kinase [Microbacterium sp. NPDC058345]|uniref:serine/threonine-protein kinase n=1 Tax=Microbacterium sp. NPDC058345 TaxID=3346455 RepID=UPI003660DDF7